MDVASVPSEAMMHFSCFRFPLFRKKIRLRGNFSQFYLFQKKMFPFSSIPPYFRYFSSTFSPISGNLLFSPTFANFPLISLSLRVFTYFICFRFPPSLTMMHLQCITQCTYWTPLGRSENQGKLTGAKMNCSKQ